MNTSSRNLYWRKNIHTMLILLIIWFVVSFLCGIVFVEQLNQIRLGGYKLGFWFAQQGAMYCFVGLVFFYAWRMRRLDKQFAADEQANPTTDTTPQQ